MIGTRKIEKSTTLIIYHRLRAPSRSIRDTIQPKSCFVTGFFFTFWQSSYELFLIFAQKFPRKLIPLKLVKLIESKATKSFIASIFTWFSERPILFNSFPLERGGGGGRVQRVGFVKPNVKQLKQDI